MSLAIVLGGLGNSQMSDIRQALTVPSMGLVPYSPEGRDNYTHLEDIVEMCLATPQDVSLIGHSFGADTVLRINDRLRFWGKPVKYIGLVDPVGQNWQDLVAPSNATFDWFRRSMGFDFSFTKRAWVFNSPNGPTIVKGGHNTLPHDPEVIKRIVEMVSK